LVEGGGDPPQGRALIAQPPDLRQCLLLGRVGLDVLPIGAKTIAELDIAHALAVCTLVVHGVPCPFADGLALPLAHRGH